MKKTSRQDHPSDPGHPIKLEKELLLQSAITSYPTPLSGKNNLSNDDKIAIITDHFKVIMETFGLDLEDDSLARTPYRVAKMYVDEIFSGLDVENFPQISFIEESYKHSHRSNMVFLKVNFHSFCEHHFVPMSGTAFVAYIPHKRLIGLSKIPRIVKFFAQRPQVQERLGAQIADSLSLVLDSGDVAVSIVASHFCVIARGIEDNQSHTITNVLRGKFDHDEHLRNEFFEAINRQHPA